MWGFFPIRFEHPIAGWLNFTSASAVRRAVIAAAIMALLSQVGSAQPPKKPTFEDKELITKDDFKLKITYFKSTAGKEAPVAILLHGKRGNRLLWKGFATDLQQKGDFAVITVDLRGHGESPLPKKGELKKSDFQAMVGFDMEAVKDFLFDEHMKGNLNMNKLGIVACDFSASVALLYTELDWEKIPHDDSPSLSEKTPRGQDVQALALISPDATIPGLMANKAVTAVRLLRRPVMIGVAEKNQHDATIAHKMFEQLTSKKDKEAEEHLYYEKYEGELRGMDLVTQNAKVRGHIFAFLNKHVKEFKSEWRDRRSRLDRE